MNESLTDDQLREHCETAKLLDRSSNVPWFYESPPHVRVCDAERGAEAIRALIAEVERLRAMEAGLKAALDVAHKTAMQVISPRRKEAS